MLLLFNLDKERYGIEVSNVVEIIPSLPLQRIPGVPDYLAGLFNYRGIVVPVLDLTQLLVGRTSNSYLSTRMILVRVGKNKSHFLGLLAESVTETISIDETAISSTGIVGDIASFVSGVVLNPKGMVQVVDMDKLLPDDVKTLLWRAETGERSSLREA